MIKIKFDSIEINKDWAVLYLKDKVVDKIDLWQLIDDYIENNDDMFEEVAQDGIQ